MLDDPMEVAPYRDIPRKLFLGCSQMPYDESRAIDILRVQDLIHDLENYLEGRSEWFQMAQLDINNKDDWEFQENVLIAEHIAITRGLKMSDWVSLMISKKFFK